MSRNATAHATSEELSAYLDQELEPVRLRLVRAHLEDCEECRGRAEGLGRVVRDLRRLERFEPPPALGQLFLRRLHGTSRPQGALERIEESLAGTNLQSPIGFSFALVLAFSALLYFFAGSMDRHQRSQTSILRPTLTPPPVEQPVDRTLDVGERSFRLQDGVWRQEGLGETLQPTELAASSSAGQQMLQDLPDLAPLLEDGAAVLLEADGGVFLISPLRNSSEPQE